MRAQGYAVLGAIKEALADVYPPAPPFTAYDDDDPRPIKIVAYVYGPKGGDAATSHAWFIAGEPYVRAFFSSTIADGLVEGDKLVETVAALITNGHSFEVETRRVRTTGIGGAPAPVDVEAAWHEYAAERAARKGG